MWNWVRLPDPFGRRGSPGDRGAVGFICLVPGIFLAAAAFGGWHHTPWRDETRAFLIARDCASIAELVRKLCHEGHPLLWDPLIRAGTYTSPKTERI